MLPIPEGAWVTGEFMQDWNHLKNGDACIILTLNEGVVFASSLSLHPHGVSTSSRPPRFSKFPRDLMGDLKVGTAGPIAIGLTTS